MNLYGNELNYMSTAWLAGYALGELPSNIAITRIRPSIWIPTAEVCLVAARRKSLILRCTDSMVCPHCTPISTHRCSPNLCASLLYRQDPSFHILEPQLSDSRALGKRFLSRNKLRYCLVVQAKRACEKMLHLHNPGVIGYMMSGILVTAVYKLDGLHRLSGWRWLCRPGKPWQ